MMSLSTILLFTWFIVPYFYLADFVKDLGYTPADASTLLSVIGITNTIGMVSASNHSFLLFKSWVEAV